MGDLPISRRSATCAILSAPFAATPAGAAGRTASASQDAAIISAWNRAIAASKDLETDDALTLDDGDEPGDRLWRAIEAERKFIMAATATTLRGVSIQLWAALWEQDGAELSAIWSQDLAYVTDPDRGWNYEATFIIAALRSLKTMGA